MEGLTAKILGFQSRKSLFEITITTTGVLVAILSVVFARQKPSMSDAVVFWTISMCFNVFAFFVSFIIQERMSTRRSSQRESNTSGVSQDGSKSPSIKLFSFKREI